MKHSDGSWQYHCLEASVLSLSDGKYAAFGHYDSYTGGDCWCTTQWTVAYPASLHILQNLIYAITGSHLNVDL